MRMERVVINKIPAIIWGESSDKAYIFVHGKMSNKESAEHFARIAAERGHQTISFDLPEHGERQDDSYRCDIWHGIADLKAVGDCVFDKWQSISLYACSLGAFFSLHAYSERKFENVLFQSPIVDMEYLIQQMFKWFNVTEEMLAEEQEISTPVDILSWKYFCYVKDHPIIKWEYPTHILYGGKDNMQSLEVIEAFSKRFKCELTISEKSEHAFMEKEDVAVVSSWLQRNI